MTLYNLLNISSL